MDLKALLKEYENCSCGCLHECDIKDVRIGSGLKQKTGLILRENEFPVNLLVVADKATLRAADGILDALSGFRVTLKCYDTLRVATMDDVHEIEMILESECDGVLSVGTGSLNDPCRLACARKGKPLCIFATAPSMDGFASDSAPIVDKNFKITYHAKCPEVIIGDTAILAAAPAQLKAAGFGDMVSKYIALIDWQVSHLVSGESYCERVASLTRRAADSIMALADRVQKNDEESAGLLFECLLLTGIAMSLTKTSRPGSGTEHIMAHYIECIELLQNKTPNFHGEDVGVTTLIMLKHYKDMLSYRGVKAHKETVNWNDVYENYGVLASDVKKLNTPDTITDGIDPQIIEKNFDKIKKIVASVPTYEEVLAKMKTAGCKTTTAEIGKSEALIKDAFFYHPFMRRRLSLRRLANMFEGY